MIRERLTAADYALSVLHDTFKMGRQEPSYQNWQWAGFASLYGSAYEERVYRLEQLCSRYKPGTSDHDLFHILWEVSVVETTQ